MADEERAAKIKHWQDSLFDTFSYKGVLGGKFLGPVMDIEPRVGAAFVEKYYGHRVLVDAFLDFFGETLWGQFDANRQLGWPEDRPHYVTCLMMYLTLFRSFRAAELVSVSGGYPLQGYIIQRSIKDQAFAVCALASGANSFANVFGWDGVGASPWSKEQYGKIIKNRMQVEDKIVRNLIGVNSGLSPESQSELEKWNRMFNWEAHRGLMTMYRLSSALYEGKLPITIAPTPDEMNESMYMNRCHELGWMILRLLPYMRRAETPSDAGWDRKWTLLDDSFKMMVEGLAGLGKKIAPAVVEMVQTKFAFSTHTYYFEKK